MAGRCPDGGLAMGASVGVWRFDAAGAVRASYLRDPDWPVMGAYLDERGAHFVLKYARSVDRDLRLGFGAARVVDADACPGLGWVAEYTSGAPDRRLSEYIDIAIDGRRVHAAWTHAPALPSRIYASHWDF